MRVTVVDVGGRLEQKQDDSRLRLAQTGQSEWEPADLAVVSRQPVASGVKGLPEKRSFGSDFPFRNFGQLMGVGTTGSVNDAVVSGAYGGFSNVWGAQVMPFTTATLRSWPANLGRMDEHYAHILREIPFAAEEDDLAQLFPLIEQSTPLPELSQRSEAVLSNYGKHRQEVNQRGVVVGRARLAMNAPGCIRCGLCLTGCPYSLIYSASQTLDRLRSENRITYRSGLLAVSVEESASSATVVARDLETDRLERFSADRVFLACGAIGTSRLVMGSLKLFETTVRVAESAQFMLPFVSTSPIADPRKSADFTLNQFNMVVRLDSAGYDVSQLHFYTYNHAFVDALPSALRTNRSRGLGSQLLRRLSVALGYLPSWASPDFSLEARPNSAVGQLPHLEVSSRGPGLARNAMLREVLKRVLSSARALDLWPVMPMLKLPAPGKSYHWGSIFPHSANAHDRFSSDALGRVAPWRRIHLVDASVFPSVAATTFTLTVMANAHRIATSAIADVD